MQRNKSNGKNINNRNFCDNWVCIYSLFAWKRTILSEHYGMLTALVHACQLLCMKVITKKELKEAEQKLMRFCIMFEALCGKKKSTSNMHHCGHLQKFFLGLRSSFPSLLLFICEIECNEIVNFYSNCSIYSVEVLYVCLQIHGYPRIYSAISRAIFTQILAKFETI